MTIKVLQIAHWMEPASWGFEDTIGYYTPIDPVFNRNGQYYDTKKKIWWFESDGKAWTSTKGAIQFLWELQHLNVVPLSKREVEEFRRIAMRTADRVLRRHLNTRIYENDSALLVQYGGTLHTRLCRFRSMKDVRARMAAFKKERNL